MLPPITEHLDPEQTTRYLVMNELISKTMGTSLGGRGHRFTCGELMALGDWIMTGMIETADEGEDGNHG